MYDLLKEGIERLRASRYGTLYSKTSKGRVYDPPAARRRFFSFEMLKDPAEQVTIILAAREQDPDDATVRSKAAGRAGAATALTLEISALAPPLIYELLLYLRRTQSLRSLYGNSWAGVEALLRGDRKAHV